MKNESDFTTRVLFINTSYIHSQSHESSHTHIQNEHKITPNMRIYLHTIVNSRKDQ
ncbi:MAG: hypothetical protein ACI90V_002874 [Bacillariaceae sp.]|jgi:hypothetical protein